MYNNNYIDDDFTGLPAIPILIKPCQHGTKAVGIALWSPCSLWCQNSGNRQTDINWDTDCHLVHKNGKGEQNNNALLPCLPIVPLCL